MSACQCCGTCCLKGGPALYLADKVLVDEGVLPASCMYTLRRGELARDPLADKLIVLSTELIKLKGQNGQWTCTFLATDTMRCRIYDRRPLECRALQCWDTTEFKKVYRSQRLTRRDLLENMSGLWDLISDHETRCGYARIKKLVLRLKADKPDAALPMIMEAVRYDTEIRQLVVVKGGLDPLMTDFIFGRPLEDTMKMFGLKVERQADGDKLIKIGPDYTAAL